MDENNGTKKLEFVPVKFTDEQKAAIKHNLNIFAGGIGVGLVIGLVAGKLVFSGNEDGDEAGDTVVES